jgi:hypothetical protein
MHPSFGWLGVGWWEKEEEEEEKEEGVTLCGWCWRFG